MAKKKNGQGKEGKYTGEKFSQGEKERRRKWTKVFREGQKIHQGEVGKYLVKEKIQGNIYSSLFQCWLLDLSSIVNLFLCERSAC